MKRFFALMLTACLLLAGCGSTKDTPSAQEGIYTQAAGIAPEQTLAEIDGAPVSAARCLYFLGRSCQLMAADLGGELDFSAKQGGKTLGEAIKESALRTAALYAVLGQWAAEYLPEQASDLTQRDPDAALAAELGRDAANYRALQALAASEGHALSLSTVAATAYAQDRGLLSVAYLRVDTDEALLSGDWESLEQRQALAADVLAGLAAVSDPLAALAAAADEGQGLFFVEQLVFAPGESGLGRGVEQAAALLCAGVWSDSAVEGEGGLYLLLGRSISREDAALHFFDSELHKAAEAVKIAPSRAYRSLNMEDFWARLSS